MQVRGKRPSKGQGSRIPHAATALVGKGTPSIPPEEAVGIDATDSTGVPLIPVSQEPLAQRVEIKGFTSDRSRSRDSPGEPQQVVMTVPEYMLPMMAQAGLGHLSLDQPRVQVGSGLSLSSPAEPKSQSIRDFFDAFNQAEVQGEQVRAIQQFTQGLRDVPRLAGSPPPQETSGTTTGERGGAMSSSPAPATDGSPEAEMSQEGSREHIPESSATDRLVDNLP